METPASIVSVSPEINPIDENTFTVKVNGKDQKFLSTKGLKERK
jgi:hypothetical protein